MKSIFKEIAEDQTIPHNPAGYKFFEQVDFSNLLKTIDQVDEVVEFIKNKRPKALGGFFEHVLHEFLYKQDHNDEKLIRTYLKYRPTLIAHSSYKANDKMQSDIKILDKIAGCDQHYFPKAFIGENGNARVISALLHVPQKKWIKLSSI